MLWMSWWKCKNINGPKNRLQFLCVKFCKLHPQRLETKCNFFQLFISNTGKHMQTQPSVAGYTTNQLRVESHMHNLYNERVSGDVRHCKSHPYQLYWALAGSCICRYGWFYSCSHIWIFIFLFFWEQSCCAVKCV